jgi:dTDP-4-dehydrorhamnose reductase
MKILLIGARGMLGRDLQPILSDRHEVIGKDIEDLDITDPNQVQKQVETLRPQTVINAAAFTDVDGCESQKDLAFKVNAEGAGQVARVCRKAGARLIYLSTDYVFDGTSRVPYSEEAQPNPINVYGESKLGGEEAVQQAEGNYLILRTAWLYGKHGKNFVDTILRLASKQKELRVVDDQQGSPTFTRDLSRAIARLLENDVRGILHVTNSGSCSWFEFAQKILETKGIPGWKTRVIPISSRQLNRPARRPSNSVLNCSRFEELTGAKMRPWEEALGDYLSESPNHS